MDARCVGCHGQAAIAMKPLAIDIAPIPDTAVLQTIVAAALAAKRSADTPRKTSWDACAESTACSQRLPYSS